MVRTAASSEEQEHSMKRIMSALTLVTMAALSVVACGGDDDDDTTNTGGTSGTGGTKGSSAGEPATGNGGEPATGNGGAPSGNVMCDPSEEGVCQNAIDCPFVVDGTARVNAGTCGQGCVGMADDCSRDCILEKLDMSSECATCYADTVNCTIAKCLAECIGDPEADACKQCQVDEGCRAAFDECSGLPG
jgi:hypothetical protein